MGQSDGRIVARMWYKGGGGEGEGREMRRECEVRWIGCTYLPTVGTGYAVHTVPHRACLDVTGGIKACTVQYSIYINTYDSSAVE